MHDWEIIWIAYQLCLGMSARRPERYQQSESGEQWITIGGVPDPERGVRHAGGTPVKVDDAGQIVAGPEGLEGRQLSEIDQNKEPSGELADLKAARQMPRTGRVRRGESRKEADAIVKAWLRENPSPWGKPPGEGESYESWSARYFWVRREAGLFDHTREAGYTAPNIPSDIPWFDNTQDAMQWLKKWEAENPQPEGRNCPMAGMEWHDAQQMLWHLCGGAAAYRRQVEAKQTPKPPKQLTEFETQRKARAQRLLTWAQKYAGSNREAAMLLSRLEKPEAGPPTKDELHEAWYPGAAQYVMRRLVAAGAKRVRRSERGKGVRGSYYYQLPEGTRVRISDHYVPETVERVLRRAEHGYPHWAEIVLDYVREPEEIDRLIDEILAEDAEIDDD